MKGAAVKAVLLGVVLAVMVSVSGCLAMAVGYTGYALSKSSGEKADKEAESRIVDSYSRYRTEMEKTNMEREKAGLKPQPIQSFAEWKVASRIAPTVPEAAKETKEAKAETPAEPQPESAKAEEQK